VAPCERLRTPTDHQADAGGTVLHVLYRIAQPIFSNCNLLGRSGEIKIAGRGGASVATSQAAIAILDAPRGSARLLDHHDTLRSAEIDA
jgi:hypothetical protein